MIAGTESGASRFYASKSDFRTKKLIVEGHSFHVNPSALAEKSNFFKNLFYGGFKENDMEEIELKEESAEEFSVFLDLMGANSDKFRPLDAKSLSIAYSYADKWQIEFLKDQCRAFACEKHKYADMPVNDAINVLRMCIELRLGRDAIVTAIDYISTNFSPDLLKKEKIHEKIASSGAVLAIIDRFSWRHSFSMQTSGACCDICQMPVSYQNFSFYCVCCKQSYCQLHNSQTECDVINESEKYNVVEESYLYGLI